MGRIPAGGMIALAYAGDVGQPRRVSPVARRGAGPAVRPVFDLANVIRGVSGSGGGPSVAREVSGLAGGG